MTGISTNEDLFKPSRADVDITDSVVEINANGYPNVYISDYDMLSFIKNCDDSKVYTAIGDDPKFYVMEFMDKTINCYKEINTIKNKLAMDAVRKR